MAGVQGSCLKAWYAFINIDPEIRGLITSQQIVSAFKKPQNTPATWNVGSAHFSMSDIDGLRMVDRKSRKSLNQQGLTKLLQDKSSSHLGAKGGIPKPFPTATGPSKFGVKLVGYKK